MTESYNVSLLALILSILSLVTSFVTLYRDRHKISASAVPIEEHDGLLHFSVSVSNSGKRPISITHILIKPQNHAGCYINFSSNNENRIDVGEKRSCLVTPSNFASLPFLPLNVKELLTFDIFVEDALGVRHRAIWNKTQSLINRLWTKIRTIRLLG